MPQKPETKVIERMSCVLVEETAVGKKSGRAFTKNQRGPNKSCSFYCFCLFLIFDFFLSLHELLHLSVFRIVYIEGF